MTREEIRLEYENILAKIKPLEKELEALRTACGHPAKEFSDDSGDGASYYTCPDCGSVLCKDRSGLHRI